VRWPTALTINTINELTNIAQHLPKDEDTVQVE